MARHGTRRCYVNGCRCDDCTESNRAYFRQRRASHMGADLPASEPGPVESGVAAELECLTVERPGVAQTALALARVLDSPRAVSSHAPAARVLITLLDKLRQASAPSRRGHLASVRTMSKKGGRMAESAGQVLRGM
jgi:hypothetical protein